MLFFLFSLHICISMYYVLHDDKKKSIKRMAFTFLHNLSCSALGTAAAAAPLVEAVEVEGEEEVVQVVLVASGGKLLHN